MPIPGAVNTWCLVGGQRCIYSHRESSIRRPVSSHGLSLQVLRCTASAGHPPVGMLAGRFDTTARLIAARPARVAPIARSLPGLLGSADSGHAPSLLLCEPSTRRQTRQPKSWGSLVGAAPILRHARPPYLSARTGWGRGAIRCCAPRRGVWQQDANGARLAQLVGSACSVLTALPSWR